MVGDNKWCQLTPKYHQGIIVEGGGKVVALSNVCKDKFNMSKTMGPFNVHIHLLLDITQWYLVCVRRVLHYLKYIIDLVFIFSSLQLFTTESLY